jgi:hypothetical protein
MSILRSAEIGQEFGGINCLTEERIVVGNMLEPGVFSLFMAIGCIIFSCVNR